MTAADQPLTSKLSGFGTTVFAEMSALAVKSQLENKAHANSQLIPHDFGLGDKSETVRMTMEHMGSTIYTDGSDKKDVPSAKVEIRDIASTWEALAFDHVDLMKINIEGAEFPLLERMIEMELLQNVGCFLIQFHEWHPGAYRRRRNIREALSNSHQLVWDYHFVWEKWVLK